MEHEIGYVSKYLTHFVGRGKALREQYEILKKILGTRWLTHPPHLDQPSLALAVHPGRQFADNDMIVPEMICFCDIPAVHLTIHTQKYSQFGVAFPKAYLISKGANPVLYVAKTSGILRKKPEHRNVSPPKRTVTQAEYEELMKQPIDPDKFASEPRGKVLDEYMGMLWQLWYEREPFEAGQAGEEAAAIF